MKLGRKRRYLWGILCLLILAGLLIWRGFDRASDLSGAYYQGTSLTGEAILIRVRPDAAYQGVVGSIAFRTNIFHVSGQIRDREIIAHSLILQPYQRTTNAVLRGQLVENRMDLSVSNSLPANGQVARFSLNRVAEERRFSGSKVFRLGRYGASQKATSHFPHIDASDFIAAQELNSNLDRLAKNHIEDFQRDFWGLVKDGIRFPGASFDWVSELDFELVMLASNLVSMRTFNYSFTGGAHGNYYYQGVNYFSDGSKSVEEFHFEEVFGEDSGGIEICETECLSRLREQGAGYIDDGSVLSFDEKDLDAFTLCESGLVFHFSPYHVGPYSQGAFHVLVPAELLKGSLSKSRLGLAIGKVWSSASH